MSSTKDLTVERIFLLQEKCLEHALLPLVADRFTFIKSCIELIINRHVYAEILTKADKKKLSVIHALLSDHTSNLIVSLKLALYGACVESLSLLRIALESITVMAWRIEKGKFHEDVSFNKARQQIRARTEIKELYTRLSKEIIHLDGGTRRFQRFKLHGKTYPVIGMSIDPDSTKLVLGELARATLYVVRVLSDFYNTKREVVGEDYFGRVSELEQRYRLLPSESC